MSKICGLEQDINKCPHFNKDNGQCKYSPVCTYQMEKKSESEFTRNHRWYEKYYHYSKRI